jgi:hypothetical protein
MPQRGLRPVVDRLLPVARDAAHAQPAVAVEHRQQDGADAVRAEPAVEQPGQLGRVAGGAQLLGVRDERGPAALAGRAVAGLAAPSPAGVVALPGVLAVLLAVAVVGAGRRYGCRHRPGGAAGQVADPYVVGRRGNRVRRGRGHLGEHEPARRRPGGGLPDDDVRGLGELLGVGRSGEPAQVLPGLLGPAAEPAHQEALRPGHHRGRLGPGLRATAAYAPLRHSASELSLPPIPPWGPRQPRGEMP